MCRMDNIMNWMYNILLKEARGRRYKANDRVRYFIDNLKGKGRGVVLTPNFTRGTIVDYDPESRRYRVRGSDDQENLVHPRNIVPDIVGRQEVSPPLQDQAPIATQEVSLTGE